MSEPTGRIAHHRWWHTIELAPGVITPGAWDLRPMANRLPWPESLSGARCLDVGTMDGFWAFEMERRGATDVLGIDLGDPARLDLPVSLRLGRHESGKTEAGDTFQLAARHRGSRAVWKDLSVYDLSPARLGLFDLVFIGYTINLLQDPVAALEAIREVCRGSVIVLDEISLPLTLLHRVPVAKFAPREGQLEWWVFNAAGLRRALTVAGFRPVAESPLMKFQPGPGTNLSEVSAAYRLRHAVGLAGVSLAIRGLPVLGPRVG